MGRRRRFSIEFKRDVVRDIETGRRTLKQVAREEEIVHSVLERWCKKFREGTLEGGGSQRERRLERELDRYKKKVGELTMQIELLKKIDESLALTRSSSGSIVTGMNAGAYGKDVG
jgi:transposase-like protein